MPLSQSALQGILASATSVVYLECLTISHSEIVGGPIRIVNNGEDITRTAGVFMAFPFTVKPPAQAGDQSPTLEITVDVVDQRILMLLRALGGRREKALITYEVVTGASPNTIEWGPVTFQFDSMNSDGMTSMKIRASYSLSLLNDAFPTRLFSPGNRVG